MSSRVRYSLLCESERVHFEKGSACYFFAELEHEAVRERVQKEKERLDGQRVPCGPHRIRGPALA